MGDLIKDIQFAVQKEFAARSEELSRREEAVTAREERVKDFWSNDLSKCVPIVLRVGDRIFHTTRDVLLAQPDSFFSGLLSDKFKQKQGDEPYFIPRDGDAFAFVLKFLTYGEAALKKIDKQMKAMLLLDADFYALSTLKDQLEDMDASVLDGDGDESVLILDSPRFHGNGDPFSWSLNRCDSAVFTLRDGMFDHDTVHILQVHHII
ncbi:EF-hand domain-containing protein 1 [Irineochytrium annulatum]|nr:EF-hand domain-containing protein 1 [Irineochytrium annulatum]